MCKCAWLYYSYASVIRIYIHTHTNLIACINFNYLSEILYFLNIYLPSNGIIS